MYITNNIPKEKFEEVCKLLEEKKIFFILRKDIENDYRKRRLYVLVDKGKYIGCFSIVYEKENMYYAFKRACIFEESDKHKGYGSLMLKLSMKLGFHPIGMTPWITNPVSTGLAKKIGLKLQYIFNEKYGWWLEY